MIKPIAVRLSIRGTAEDAEDAEVQTVCSSASSAVEAHIYIDLKPTFLGQSRIIRAPMKRRNPLLTLGSASSGSSKKVRR
jgi:hypothetical protein